MTSSFYVRLIITVLIVVALAQFVPEAINAFLVIVIAGMLIMNAGQFASLIKTLNLK